MDLGESVPLKQQGAFAPPPERTRAVKFPLPFTGWLAKPASWKGCQNGKRKRLQTMDNNIVPSNMQYDQVLIDKSNNDESELYNYQAAEQKP